MPICIRVYAYMHTYRYTYMCICIYVYMYPMYSIYIYVQLYYICACFILTLVCPWLYYNNTSCGHQLWYFESDILNEHKAV